jgi:hypothetical protein
MNDHRQIKFRLKEAEMYLQFLNEDLDLAESINESIASQIDQLLKEATTRLRNDKTSEIGESLTCGGQRREEIMSIAEIVAYAIILFLGCLIILFASGKFFTLIQ